MLSALFSHGRSCGARDVCFITNRVITRVFRLAYRNELAKGTLRGVPLAIPARRSAAAEAFLGSFVFMRL